MWTALWTALWTLWTVLWTVLWTSGPEKVLSKKKLEEQKKNHRTLAAICEAFILVGDVELKKVKSEK